MKDKLSFKRVKQDQYKIILDLEKLVSNNYTYCPTFKEDEIKEEIKNNESYIIYKNKDLVGSISYCIKNKKVYISDLIVIPPFQGLGIGSKAIDFVLKKNKSFNNIWLVTHPHNSPAIKIYLSKGFIIKEWKDNYFRDGQPRLVLEKKNKISKKI